MKRHWYPLHTKTTWYVSITIDVSFFNSVFFAHTKSDIQPFYSKVSTNACEECVDQSIETPIRYRAYWHIIRTIHRNIIDNRHIQTMSAGSFFDSCSDSCGWTAAIVALFAYGTYGVPIKETHKIPDLNPLVFQSYKSVVMFAMAPMVVMLGVPLRFTPWGILSGLLWVLGGTCCRSAICRNGHRRRYMGQCYDIREFRLGDIGL